MLPLVDEDGAVAAASAEAHAALIAGDSEGSQEKRAQAADILLRKAASIGRSAEKQYIFFLAATQYYKGGLYAKALDLCRKIQENVLPEEVRPMYPKFLRDVKDRSSPDYKKCIEAAQASFWNDGQFNSVLELLAEHPFLFPSGVMASLRAFLCERLGDYRAAAVFYASMVRISAGDPDVAFPSVVYALSLARQRRLDEAWKYVQCQLEFLPSIPTYVGASIVCCLLADRDAWSSENPWYARQIQYFEEVEKRIQGIPDAVQRNPNLHAPLVVCYEAAAMTFARSNRPSRAKKVCDVAVQLDPKQPGLWTIRGLVAYPQKQAMVDFAKAASLADRAYCCYYMLTLDALERHDFTAAQYWVEEALVRNPPDNIRAQLYGWKAVCSVHLAKRREEILQRFDEALKIDPQNKEVFDNYQAYIGLTKSSRSRIQFSAAGNIHEVIESFRFYGDFPPMTPSSYFEKSPAIA